MRVNLVPRVPWLFGQREVSPGDLPLTAQPEDTGYGIAHAVCLVRYLDASNPLQSPFNYVIITRYLLARFEIK